MKKGKHTVYKKYKRKNLMARLKPLFIVIACLIAACAGAFGVYYYLSHRPVETEVIYEQMEGSTLPVLTMEYEGRDINRLYGYTSGMDLDYVCETVYLLENSYEIPINITLYDNTVSSVDFYIYDTEGGSLVQNGTSGELETEDGILSTSLTIDQVISNDTEYVLDIVLNMDDESEIHYYTRLLRSLDTSTAEQIELAFSFSEATLSGDEDLLGTYMNTNPWTQSNTNFSGVNLKSSLSQMMWKDMEVSLYGDYSLSILDIYDNIGCYRIDYMVTRTEGETQEYYYVSEYFRVRIDSSYTKILSYERTVNQVFLPDEDLLSTTSVNLGILESDDLETAASDNGTYSCFVVNGSLWCMDSSSKTLSRIFSFDSDDLSDSRASNPSHDIKIISVEDTGDIEFIVYGYMNSGLHEGLSGVGLYSYSFEDGEVTEELFIQADISYEVLKETAGEMAYVNEENDMYILIDQRIYLISLDTCDLKLVADGLTDGSFAVSLTGSVIAWQEDGAVNDALTINVLDAETGNTFEINAQEGYCVKILGFIGSDLVYGSGESGNIYELLDEECLMMDVVYVVDTEGNIQSENTADSGYFISAEYEYNRIIISRTDGDDFTLFSSEITETEVPEVTQTYDEIKEYEYYLNFTDSTTTAGDFTVDTSAAVNLTDACLVSPSGFLDLSGCYLVYGKGHLQLITSSASEAVLTAYDEEGCVRTEGGAYFYRRGVVPGSITFTDNNIESAVRAYNNGEIINVTGITRTTALYFLGEKIPVYWEYDGTVYVIYGYDTSENIKLYNIETGETSTMTGADFDEVFETEGSVYVRDNS